MSKKKFRPVIHRVKLNPEQAVLQCQCYNFALKASSVADLYYGPSSTFACITDIDKTAWGAVPGGSCHATPNQQHAMGATAGAASS